jgi:hypothetical protein
MAVRRDVGVRRSRNLGVSYAPVPIPVVGAPGTLDFSRAANSGLLLLLFDDI